MLFPVGNIWLAVDGKTDGIKRMHRCKSAVCHFFASINGESRLNGHCLFISCSLGVGRIGFLETDPIDTNVSIAVGLEQ